MQRQRWRGVEACLAALALASCSPMAGMDPIPARETAEFLLGPGDEVRVMAYGLDGFSANYTVSDYGSLSLPLIGDVPASGQSVGQIQRAIVAQLVAKRILVQPVVNVQVNQYRPFFVLGEVKKPGEYQFRPGTSVLNAISIAGGYTFRANTSKVAITRRRGDGTFTAAASENAVIQPGDTIRVFERWF